MARKVTEKEESLIKSMYVDDGVSMKNIALYFQQIGKPIDESTISKYLKNNGLSRKKGGSLNTQSMPSIETVYSMALRLMSSTMNNKTANS